jgi:hypothetical protein
VVTRGRWGQPGAPAGLQTAPVWVCPKIPRGPAVFGPSARDGLSVPGEQKTEKKRSSPVCSTGDQRHPSGELGCRTAGCERGPMPMQVATRPFEAGDRSAANTERVDAKKLASISVRVQTVRLRSGSRDCRAVKLLSTQIVRKQAKAISFRTTPPLHATSPSTLPNSTNGWRDWQRRS